MTKDQKKLSDFIEGLPQEKTKKETPIQKTMSPKKGRKKTDMEWIDEKIGMRTSVVEDLKKASNECYNAFYWTPLKLICIGYYTRMYTNIISNRFNQWLYFDLFAGCGLNRFENKDYFPGSPIVVLEAAKRNPFRTMYLIESQSHRANALKSRFDLLSTNNQEYSFLGNHSSSSCQYKVLTQTSSDFIISNEFENAISPSNIHGLAVIDPYSFEFGWNDLKMLFRWSLDIIFLFVTSQIRRTWGSAKKNKRGAIKQMDSLFPNQSWRKAEKGDDLVRIFTENIEDEGLLAKSIKIQGSTKGRGKFRYDLFFIVGKTSGGNPWFNKAVESLKARVERTDGKFVEAAFDYLMGRRYRITDFLGK